MIAMNCPCLCCIDTLIQPLLPPEKIFFVQQKIMSVLQTRLTDWLYKAESSGRVATLFYRHKFEEDLRGLMRICQLFWVDTGMKWNEGDSRKFSYFS